jgi:hypothetical protein
MAKRVTGAAAQSWRKPSSQPGRQIPVTLSALIARINRALAKDDRTLRKNRHGPYMERFGDYYIVDTQRNFVVFENAGSPEELGRELGVLKPWEKVS